MDFSLALFLLLTLIFSLALTGKYRLSLYLFGVFLVAGFAVFYHHITSHLPIDL